MLNREFIFILLQDFSFRLSHFINAGEARPAFSLFAKHHEDFAPRNRVNFHAPVKKILHVSAHAQRVSGALRKKAITDALHAAGNINTLCRKPSGHVRRLYQRRILSEARLVHRAFTFQSARNFVPVR